MCNKKHGSHSKRGAIPKQFHRYFSLLALAVFLFSTTSLKSLASLQSHDDPITRWENEILPTLLQDPFQVEKRLVLSGFQKASGRTIDTIVLHSCYNPGLGDRYSVEAILALFSRERVSAHYLIDREGTVYQLVNEENISYHAGKTEWQGRQAINKYSLGIELINHTEDRYTEAQYRSLELLLQDIERRHTIRFLVAHGEIAPERRSDPWNFDWSRVARFRNR